MQTSCLSLPLIPALSSLLSKPSWLYQSSHALTSIQGRSTRLRLIQGGVGQTSPEGRSQGMQCGGGLGRAGVGEGVGGRMGGSVDMTKLRTLEDEMLQLKRANVRLESEILRERSKDGIRSNDGEGEGAGGGEGGKESATMAAANAAGTRLGCT